MAVPFKITDEIDKEYKKREFKLFKFPEVSDEEKEKIWNDLEMEFKRRCEVRNRVNGWYKKYNKVEGDKIKNVWVLDICPSDELGVERFKQFIFELFKKKIFQSYYYVFEQRGECERDIGKGIHCHSIVEFNSPSKSLSFFLDEVFKFIRKKNYENLITKNNVELNKINTDLYLNNRIKYVNPFHFCKTKDEKIEAWSLNEAMRSKWDIKPFYISQGNLLIPQQVQTPADPLGQSPNGGSPVLQAQ